MANTSVALLLYGLVIVVCRVAFATVPDRLPPLPLGMASLVAIAVGMVVMALWLTPAGLMVGVVVTAIGVTFSTPAFFSAIFATASSSERGAAAGTASAFIDLGLGFGPICLGLVARSGGIPAAFLAGAAIAALGAVWVGWLSSRTRSAAPVG
jgi:predicted MFS family arabinose efflux permease